MRIIVLLIVTLALALPSATASTSGKIDINATIVAERVNGDQTRRSWFVRLWSRLPDREPIGEAFASCLLVARDDLGRKVWGCNASYRLPRGQMVTSGHTKSLDSFTLPITGGTGLYIGQGGVAYSTRIGPGKFRVLMRLVP